MTTDWTDLSAFLSHSDYYAKPGDRHWQATKPLEALPCRCEQPWLALDDGASVLEMRGVSEHEHGDPRPTMKTAEAIEDSARIRRLTEFATDALDLADRRADLDLRALLDDLYRDLIELEEER